MTSLTLPPIITQGQFSVHQTIPEVMTFTLTNSFAWNILLLNSHMTCPLPPLNLCSKNQLFRDASPEYLHSDCHPFSQLFPSLMSLSIACHPTYYTLRQLHTICKICLKQCLTLSRCSVKRRWLNTWIIGCTFTHTGPNITYCSLEQIHQTALWERTHLKRNCTRTYSRWDNSQSREHSVCSFPPTNHHQLWLIKGAPPGRFTWLVWTL